MLLVPSPGSLESFGIKLGACVYEDQSYGLLEGECTWSEVQPKSSTQLGSSGPFFVKFNQISSFGWIFRVNLVLIFMAAHRTHSCFPSFYSYILLLTERQGQEHPSAEGVGHADGPLRLHEAADLHGDEPAHDVERREAHLKENLDHVQAQVPRPALRRCSCLVGRWDKQT